MDLMFKNEKFTFHSDRGVFSKNKIDEGSKALLDYVAKNPLSGSLLDVGCGYGLLGIVCKKLNPELTVTMIDVNLRALALSQANARLNQVEVVAIESDGYQKITDKFDLILSNPPIRAGKAVVMRILVEAKEHLNAGGELIVVIRKNHGALSALGQMQTTFDNGEIVKRHKGYYILRSVMK